MDRARPGGHRSTILLGVQRAVAEAAVRGGVAALVEQAVLTTANLGDDDKFLDQVAVGSVLEVVIGDESRNQFRCGFISQKANRKPGWS